MKFARAFLFLHVVLIVLVLFGLDTPLEVVFGLLLSSPLLLLYPVAVVYSIYTAVTQRNELKWFDYLNIAFLLGLLLLESL